MKNLLTRLPLCLLLLLPLAARADVLTNFVTVDVQPPGAGIPGGGGGYLIGSNAVLSATPVGCWVFTNWSDGSTDNPHTITVGNTASTNYTAFFFLDPNGTYTLTTTGSPVEGGSVRVIAETGVPYPCNSSVMLVATSSPCWMFTNWSDGSTDNPHLVTVSPGNLDFTANFIPLNYFITATSSPPASGTVSGGGWYACGSNVTLTATPNACWVFTNWNDGSTDNPHTIIASANDAYTANFFEKMFRVQTKVAPPHSGTVTGGGITNCGATVTVTATPAAGFKFVDWTSQQWVFGSSPPQYKTIVLGASPHYTLTAGADKTLTANFIATNHAPCTFSISPTNSPVIPQDGGGGTVEVSASAGCDWTYSNPNPNIHIIKVTDSSLEYGVDAAPTLHETGSTPGTRVMHPIVPYTLLVAGQTFTVRQVLTVILEGHIPTVKEQ